MDSRLLSGNLFILQRILSGITGPPTLSSLTQWFRWMEVLGREGSDLKNDTNRPQCTSFGARLATDSQKLPPL